MNWKPAKEVCSEVSIKWAVGTFNKLKSSQVDGIFTALLQRGQEIILAYLVRVVKDAALYIVYTEGIQTGKSIFIPKAGKKDLPEIIRT